MKKNLESRLDVVVEHSEYVEYDENKLFDAISYFCYHNLKHIDANDLPNIYIEIDNDDAKSIDGCGYIVTIDEDTVLIALSTKNIKETAESENCFSSPIKTLFKVFLYEFKHLLVLIDLYLKREKGINLEMIEENRYKESLKECRRLKRQGFHSEEIWFNRPEEQACDWFAFQNLGLFENLYEYGFLYTPWTAFMAKVKKAKRDTKMADTQLPNDENIIEIVQPAQSQ